MGIVREQERRRGFLESTADIMISCTKIKIIKQKLII